MSEVTINPIARNEAAQPEPWNPGGSLIAALVAGVALFFIASVFVLIAACVLTSVVDVPH
jgi:hypothetical protein